MRRVLVDLAVALLGGFVGMVLPPVVQQAAAFLVLLAVLAVLGHLCGRALALFARVPARPMRVPLADAPSRPLPLLTTPTLRRLLAWLACRDPHLHTGSPRPGRRLDEPDVPLPLATSPP